MTEMLMECKNKTDFMHALEQAADNLLYSEDFRTKNRYMI